MAWTPLSLHQKKEIRMEHGGFEINLLNGTAKAPVWELKPLLVLVFAVFDDHGLFDVDRCRGLTQESHKDLFGTYSHQTLIKKISTSL